MQGRILGGRIELIQGMAGRGGASGRDGREYLR